ncbi:MAG: hypothetical protein AABW82_00010 [Nanoarchaeota archaeon]
MIFDNLSEARELKAVRDLYDGLYFRYRFSGLNDYFFNLQYIKEDCPLSRFIKDFTRIVKSRKIEDLDESSTSTALDELVDMEKELISLEFEQRRFRQEV